MKRKRLIALGWSPRALHVAVARTDAGDGHTVLVVKASRGDLVLYNRTSAILNWKNTYWRWIKIPSGDDPRIWFDISPPNIAGGRQPAARSRFAPFHQFKVTVIEIIRAQGAIIGWTAHLDDLLEGKAYA